jgi:hypothetical protein
MTASRAALADALMRAAPAAALRLATFIRPAALFARGGQPRIGGSRLGGLPDLSDALEWPTRPATAEDPDPVRSHGRAGLDFLAQIDLGECAGLHDLPLPDHGRLCFFCDVAHASSPAGGAAASAWRLIHDAGPGRTARPRERSPDIIVRARFPATDVVAQPHFDLPDAAAPVWRRAIAPDFPDAAHQIESSNESAFAALREPALLQLGGSARSCGARAAQDIAHAQAPAPSGGPEDWRVVLQMTPHELAWPSWTRAERLVVLMRGADLLDGEYGAAWSVVLSDN